MTFCTKATTTKKRSHICLNYMRSYLPNLAKVARSSTTKIYTKNIVVKMLKSKARVEFVKQGDKNLRDEGGLLDLL